MNTGIRVRASLPLLHRLFHLAHLALKEPVDADLAPVSVEGDGGEAGERGVDHKKRSMTLKPCFFINAV